MTNKGEATKCKKCGNVIDLRKCTAIQKLNVKVKSLKEQVTNTLKNSRSMRLAKNGEIQKMHLMLKEMSELLTPKQKEKFSLINQRCREEIKRIKKISQKT